MESLTPTSGTITVNSSAVTSHSLAWQKSGHVVVISGAMQIASGVTPNTNLFTMPYAPANHATNTITTINNSGTTNIMCGASQVNMNVISLNATAGWYNINIAYVTAS